MAARKKVSILVFLDSPATQPILSVRNSISEKSFNPCFPGLSCNLRLLYRERPLPVSVSILVFLDSPATLAEWLAVSEESNVSILVFLDSPATLRYCERQFRMSSVSILVFLDSPATSESSKMSASARISFNPYFLGLSCNS